MQHPFVANPLGAIPDFMFRGNVLDGHKPFVGNNRRVFGDTERIDPEEDILSADFFDDFLQAGGFLSCLMEFLTIVQVPREVCGYAFMYCRIVKQLSTADQHPPRTNKIDHFA
jgi:hypothetical protein